MASAPLLTLQNIKQTFGSTDLLDGAELFVGEGERLALVGRNGSGKSTLLKVAAGLMEPDGGRRFAQPGAVVRYLPQEPSLAGFATVRDYVEAGLTESDDPKRAFALLGKLGLEGREATAHLSGGEARRAALARALAPNPDILLLDEPTNHLDLPAIEWLEEELLSMNAALVIISHDRRFLENLSRATVWLDRGRTRRLERGFAHYENWRDEVLEQEEIERHKLDRKIAQEEDWVRYGVSGRRKRNVKRMAALGKLRQSRREALQAMGSVNFTATDTGANSAKVIDAKRISKAFGTREVVKDVSIRILRGDRVGIVGPNGAGKTTLINLLTGRMPPDGGNVKIGISIEIASLDQNRTPLHPEDTLVNVIGGGSTMIDIGGKPRHVVSYMKDFLFTPEQARTPVRVLSGGERARLLLAMVLARPSNLLVLDEPTNDLDLETLDLLEEMIDDYPGTAIVVSHDRDFLDRVATSILFTSGDGHFTEYAGGYSDMLAQRGEGVVARTGDKPREAKTPRKKADAAKAKTLNFADKHALETLPKTIAALEKEIGALQRQLSQGDAYVRDPATFMATTARLNAKQVELAGAEERWLELEIRREEFES